MDPRAQGDEDAAEGDAPDASAAPFPVIATAMAGGSGTLVVSAEVSLVGMEANDLDGSTVVGSFAVDGMTFALGSSAATLVAVSSDAVSEDGSVAVPATVSCGDAAYDVASVGPYALYLSGAAEVALPATVSSVDERAFRSSDVAWAEVDPESPHLASFDGAVYSADLSSLLLIPEGRAGAVRIPSTAASVPPSAFSHCAGVTSIAVDAGGAAFSSWDGCLYDASGTTLLRVPAGATDIAIKDGCTTVAAGSMEGCAKLETIEAPASVAYVSPDAFSRETPTFSLPAASLLPHLETSAIDLSEGGSADYPMHLTVTVALDAQG